jgi:aspartyl protease
VANSEQPTAFSLCQIKTCERRTPGFGFIAWILLTRYEMRLLVSVLLVAFGLPLSAQSKVLAEIPFQYRDGLIWLKVRITGKSEPLNFLLDSGAGVSVVDLKTAHTLRLKLGARQTVQGVNGKGIGYRVNELQAASSGIDLPRSVLAIDLGTLSECCHQPIDGILGADFFRGRIVQIDFAAGRVRLLENCDVNLANCEALPMKMCNDACCVPVRVAGNQPEWMRLDTGCDAALEWVVSGPGKRPIEQTSIGLSPFSRKYVKTAVQIGKQHFTIPAAIHEKPIFSGEGGLLGNSLLSKFRLTIDEPGNRVIFEETR